MSETYSNMQSVDTELIGTINELGSGGKEEIYIGSGEMPEGYVLQIDPEGTADTIPTKTSQLENDSGFITLKDLPADELPTVTEADNGKVLRVVNGVWAADTILIEQDTSNWELITEVALDAETAKYILCSCDEYDKIEIMIKRDSNNTSLTGNMIFEIVNSNGNSVVELYSNNVPGNREKLTIMEVNSGYAHCIATTSNNFYATSASLSRGYYVGNGCKYCLKIPKPDTACDGLSTMTVIGRRR